MIFSFIIKFTQSRSSRARSLVQLCGIEFSLFISGQLIHLPTPMKGWPFRFGMDVSIALIHAR